MKVRGIVSEAMSARWLFRDRTARDRGCCDQFSDRGLVAAKGRTVTVHH
jgi:hypothetical protein